MRLEMSAFAASGWLKPTVLGKPDIRWSPDLGLILIRSKIESIGGFLVTMVLLWKFSALQILERLRLIVGLTR